MSTPFWSGLSDEQWAEPQMLMARTERLKSLLLQEQIKTTQLTGERDTLVVELAQARADHGAMQMHLRGRLVEAEADAQRERDRLTLVCRTLTPVVVEWLTHYAAFKDESLNDETLKMKQSALELLRLMTPWSE